MGPWEVLGMIAVAILGAGGPISLLITRKTSQESKDTIQKSTETIIKGTEVLAASKDTLDSSHEHASIINRRLKSIEHTLGIATDLSANITSRINGHDREIKEHGEKLANHEARLDAYHDLIQHLEDRPQ